jgi:hypothetical protein
MFGVIRSGLYDVIADCARDWYETRIFKDGDAIRVRFAGPDKAWDGNHFAVGRLPRFFQELTGRE